MHLLLIIGLVVSLTAIPFSLELFRRLHFNPWALVPRFVVWMVSLVLIAMAATCVGSWREAIGVVWPTWNGMGWAIVVGMAIFVVMNVLLLVEQWLGLRLEVPPAPFKTLLKRSFGYRVFIALTASVTEEVLYRSYAIGVGELLFGSLWVACILSVIAFTLAHRGLGAGYLLPVFAAAVVFTMFFVLTRNLWLCIFAHAVVDGIGLLVAPAAARLRAQLGEGAG